MTLVGLTATSLPYIVPAHTPTCVKVLHHASHALRLLASAKLSQRGVIEKVFW
jgi:hypothetical protein